MHQYYPEYRQSLYGSPVVFDREKPKSSDPVTHTMRKINFKKYIGRYKKSGLDLDSKKFNHDQTRMIAKAYDTGLTIHVISGYTDDLDYLISSQGFSAVGKSSYNEKSHKLFNNRRQLFGFVDTNRDGKADELWVLVFPSPEYVDQIGELLNSILEDFKKSRKAEKPGSCVYVSHFHELEKNMPQWTGFNDVIGKYVTHGDVCLIGNIEWILKGLQDYSFLNWTNLDDKKAVHGLFEMEGLNNMFGFHIATHKYSCSRIVMIGMKESFWGSGCSLLVKSMLGAGAKHILYGSKAASIVDHEQVHQTYTPNRFSIVDKNGKYKELKLDMEDMSELGYNLGISPVGLSVTVPTVIGEDGKQREKIKLPGATCMDCENGHIALVVQEYNKTIGDKSDLSDDKFKATFLPVHFITDYIYRNKEKMNRKTPALGHHAGEDPVVKEKRESSFRKIGNIFGAYTLAFGITDTRSYIESIHRRANENSFQKEYQPVKNLLDVGLGRQALSYLASATDNRNYRVVSAIAYLMVCQKSGYINAALNCLKQLKMLEKSNVLSREEKFRIQSLEFKIYSQTGYTSGLSKIVESLNKYENKFHDIEQFGAMKRREAIYYALVGNAKNALKSIRQAKDKRHVKGGRYNQTSEFFKLLSQLGSSGFDINVVSKCLSNVRSVYLKPNLPEGEYQTNFEKSANAALFLESAYYLTSKHRDLISKGVKMLTIAHLLNLRLNGGIYSETYGEIIACTPDYRVKNLLGYAMRTDLQAQSIFQGWINTEYGLLSDMAKGVNDILRGSIVEREDKIRKLIY